VKLKLDFDRANFPMVYVEPLNAYMHWLPVTKIQIEYFLSSTNDTSFNDDWYQNVLGFNDRVSPGAVTQANYWMAFITGILPRDARRFAQWAGEGSMELPTAQEWFTAYQYFMEIADDPDHIEQLATDSHIKPRTVQLIRNLEQAVKQDSFHLTGGRHLCDQMIMRLGVMEYVYRDDSRNTYGGYGQTNNRFFGSIYEPMVDYPEPIANPRDGAQMKHYGFRLIKRR
jgi:hypothetical protein